MENTVLCTLRVGFHLLDIRPSKELVNIPLENTMIFREIYHRHPHIVQYL